MENNNDKLSVQGNGNIQVDGASNTISSNTTTNVFILPNTKQPLTKSCIYDLLQIIISKKASGNDSFSLVPPAEMNRKLVFNNAPRYMKKFENHSDDYARLDEVMKEFPDSEDIVKKLRDMFFDVADIGHDGILYVGNGDAHLDRMADGLQSLIKNDVNYDINTTSIEVIEQFCVALLAYGVSKCKILVNPAEDADLR